MKPKSRIYLDKEICKYFNFPFYDSSQSTEIIHKSALAKKCDQPQIADLEGDLKLTNQGYGWFYVEEVK